MKRISLAILVFALGTISNGIAQVVRVVEVESAITPLSAEFIIKALDRAEDDDAECLVIELDTPGGLLESTRDITKRILAAQIPVVVYVWPEGARAASAGVFITYSAHFAAMAPSTNIGAATPVTMGGGDIDSTSAMSHKVTNDAVAQIKTMAEKRGRNAEWAEQAIRDAASITETEALELNVVNFIAPSIDSLLTLLDGQSCEIHDGEKTLSTRNARVEYIRMNLRYRILEKVTNPNIAYILMMVGIYGIFFELWNPGTVFPGVVGAISLILAFYSFQTLPINYAGLLLMLVAVVLFILEIKITSFGLLTIGGVIAMILGSLMLIDQPPELEPLEGVIAISRGLIITMVLLTAGFFTFAVGMAVRTHRRKVTTGSEGLVGELGKALTEISSAGGSVQVHGEIWTAISDAQIAKDASIRVIEVTGLRVRVESA